MKLDYEEIVMIAGGIMLGYLGVVVLNNVGVTRLVSGGAQRASALLPG